MMRDFLPAVEYLGVLQGISLVLFFSFFVFLVIWVVRLDKKHLHKMELLPLEQNNVEIKIPGGNNE